MNKKKQTPVFVISSEDKLLMPSYRYGAIRKRLKSKEAKILKHNPFTIQLQKPTFSYKQDIYLGIDPAYEKGGYSTITNGHEIIGGEFEQRTNIPKLLQDRSKHRKKRRGRKRYRKARFDNRKKGILRLNKGDEVLLKQDVKETSFKKYDIIFFSHREEKYYVVYNKEGEYIKIENKKGANILEKTKKCLPPSIQHKKETNEKIINKITSILPISHINIETANFDIQKIKNPDIKNKEYQEGEMLGFFNTREYVLHRDNHKCQNPNCKNKSKILRVHHIVYKRHKGTDKPSNLITLCTKCHTPKNHKKGNFLYEWMQEAKEEKGFKGATFMSIINKNFIYNLRNKYPKIKINNTFGYITKHNRIKLKKEHLDKNFEKTHHTDAFIIAGGTVEQRGSIINFESNRRNNRSLTNFFDAKYIDSKDGSVKTGAELSCGRTTRNKNLNTENLKKYRKERVKNKQGEKIKGHYSKIKQRRPAEKGTIIEIMENWEGKKVFEKNRKNFVKKREVYTSQGCNEKNVTILKNNIKFSIPLKICKPIYFQKGFVPK